MKNTVSFFQSDRDVPYVLGANAQIPVSIYCAHLANRVTSIIGSFTQAGKVIDAIEYVGITAHDVRHTTNTLKKFGNLGSGAFLFSYQHLLNEGSARVGLWGHDDNGPGSTIETYLLRW